MAIKKRIWTKDLLLIAVEKPKRCRDANLQPSSSWFCFFSFCLSSFVLVVVGGLRTHRVLFFFLNPIKGTIIYVHCRGPKSLRDLCSLRVKPNVTFTNGESNDCEISADCTAGKREKKTKQKKHLAEPAVNLAADRALVEWKQTNLNIQPSKSKKSAGDGAATSPQGRTVPVQKLDWGVGGGVVDRAV